MLGKTHEIGGIAALITADILFNGVSVNNPTALLSIFAALIGALTPDLDKPTSLIYKKIPAGSIFGKIIHPIFIGGHRHLSHSIIGFFGFYLLSKYLIFKYINSPGINNNIIWYSFLIGIVSHLILDAMTQEGIPLFFPLKYKIGIPPIKNFRVVTGSFVEHIFVFPLIVIYIVFICLHYFSIISK